MTLVGGLLLHLKLFPESISLLLSLLKLLLKLVILHGQQVDLLGKCRVITFTVVRLPSQQQGGGGCCFHDNE